MVWETISVTVFINIVIALLFTNSFLIYNGTTNNVLSIISICISFIISIGGLILLGLLIYLMIIECREQIRREIFEGKERNMSSWYSNMFLILLLNMIWLIYIISSLFAFLDDIKDLKGIMLCINSLFLIVSSWASVSIICIMGIPDIYKRIIQKITDSVIADHEYETVKQNISVSTD